MKKYNLVIKRKCGAVHIFYSSDDLEDTKDCLDNLLGVVHEYRFLPVTVEADTWYLNQDEVREIRIEDHFQKVVR